MPRRETPLGLHDIERRQFSQAALQGEAWRGRWENGTSLKTIGKTVGKTIGEYGGLKFLNGETLGHFEDFWRRSLF